MVRIIAVLTVASVTVFLFLNHDRVQELEAFGYPGIFLISILSNATLILPMPTLLFTSAMGLFSLPFGLGLWRVQARHWER